MSNKIFVVGLGAIGRALAAALKLGGRKVVALRGSRDDELSRLETIRVALGDGMTLVAEVEVATLSREPDLDGIIVLTNKSYGNENLGRAPSRAKRAIPSLSFCKTAWESSAP